MVSKNNKPLSKKTPALKQKEEKQHQTVQRFRPARKGKRRCIRTQINGNSSHGTLNSRHLQKEVPLRGGRGPGERVYKL